MKKISTIALMFTLLFFGCSGIGSRKSYVQDRYEDIEDYMKARERLIKSELAMRIDAAITLTPEEERANEKLMALKQKEIERTREYFPPAHSFLKNKTRQIIDESLILEIMRRLPKGGVLHVHGFLLADYRWLIDHVTYQPDCYMYVGGNGDYPPGALRMFEKPPGKGWLAVNELRRAEKDTETFDMGLYESVTLGEEDLTQSDIWNEFQNCFLMLTGVFDNEEIMAAYIREAIRSLIEENIQYVEDRGRIISQEILQEVQNDHPEFKVKYVFSSGRSFSREMMVQFLDQAIDQREREPDRIIGFDMMQEEDETNTNLFFIKELLEARREAERRSITLPLYLHSGESNWAENENALDAVLLGVRRIGHGLSLFKHPLLMQIVREQDIAIEVCPISNQVLGYVPDLRTHPAVLFINSGLPVVICPDDPAIWKSTLSHDYYEAFMAWGLDLKCLKQLAMNSLIYSAMDEKEKVEALEYWRGRWAEFITWLNEQELAV